MDALLAVADLMRQGIQIKLKIVGNGDREYLKQLKHIVVQRNIAEHVEFIGYVDNPYSIINSGNIVLVCSRSEAFGRVTVESMLLKKPVIGTRSGTNPELIKEEFNGLLYQPGNHQELAKKIKYLTENTIITTTPVRKTPIHNLIHSMGINKHYKTLGPFCESCHVI